MVQADPSEVLGVHPVVGVEVRQQHPLGVVAFRAQPPVHVTAAPVHGRRLAGNQGRLHGVFDVVEPGQLVAELLLQPGHVPPAGLVRYPRDDPDQLQLLRVAGVDDGLNSGLQHVVGLGVGRDHAQVVVVQRVRPALDSRLSLAKAQPVGPHGAPHPEVDAPDPGDHDRRAQEPVEVEDQDRHRHEDRPVAAEGDRDPGRGKQQDPGDQPGGGLQEAVSELLKGRPSDRQGRG